MSRLAVRLLAWALVLVAAPAGGDAFEHRLLWEVSRPDSPPSHLFGTMHLADPRLLTLPPAAARAFSAARTYMLEMYPDEAVAHRFSEAGRLEGGQRLSGLVASAPFEALASRLAARGIARERVDQGLSRATAPAPRRRLRRGRRAAPVRRQGDARAAARGRQVRRID